MLTFKRATELDTLIIALLGRVTFTESHERFIVDKKELKAYLTKAFDVDKIREELQDTDNFFWLAFLDGFPVGYAKLVINSNTKFLTADKVCRLERIYVLNDFLHLKIGSQLQDLVFKKATDLNFNWVWLTVYIKNFTAINFYIKNKYKDAGIIDFSIGNDTYDNTVFVKQLG